MKLDYSIDKPFKRIWELVRSERKDITSIYFYAILSGLVQLSVPIGIQAIIGFVLGASMVTSIYILISLVVLGVILVGVFQINQMKIIEKIQQTIFTKYAFEFAELIPRFDLKKADNNYLPEVVNRFFDTLNVQKGLSKLLLEIPTASIQILFGLLLLALYHPVFIVFGFVLIFILWVILRFTSKNGLITSLKESSYKYAVVSWFEEMARVIKSFKFSQGTHLNLQKTDKNVMGYLNSRTSHFRVLLFQYRTLVVFKVTITTAMLTVGTYLLLDQQLNIGEFIAAEIVILTVINAVEKLISSLESVYDVITGLEKLATVTEKPLEQDGNLAMQTNQNGIAVELIDFSFSYKGEQNILSNLNIEIPANSITCVTGKEGNGKSSLLKVLSGSYSDFKGSILLNNVPIGNYSLESLRSNTGVLLNQQDIFEGTVWENISMGKKEVTHEQISVLANEIGIDDFLNALQNGYDTELNPTGESLPNNIIRKILLLRSLVNKPRLLLLDEPWEGLKESVKTKLIQYLKTQKNTTVIVATNDQQYIKECGFNILFENGHVKTIKLA